MILKENGGERSHNREYRQGRETEYDNNSTRSSVSSQVDEEKTEARRASRLPKKMTKDSMEATFRSTRGVGDRKEQNKLHLKQFSGNNTRKRSETPTKLVPAVTRSRYDQKIENVKVIIRPASEPSDGAAGDILEDKVVEEFKDIDISDEAPNCDQSVGTDNETVSTEENSLDDKLNPYNKIEEMEIRIEKLEEELREVAALELSLYSVVPQHGSSTHKLHTPAKRLSRLYIHACKHWSLDKKESVAKNIASGLVFIVKSCGNDVTRLTFWLSNIIVLREIIFLALENCFTMGHAHVDKVVHRFEGRTFPCQSDMSFHRHKQMSGFEALKGLEEWQETSTFISALERIESWIFARVVESIWWQTLVPLMQSPVGDKHKHEGRGKFPGPSLGDQWQGTNSINLWKDAFMDAFNRLCPIRANGTECGCLLVLARMVMEQCISRLDVAMFNAILRESANQIPTDPLSDPIVNVRILPIPAGDLSFGSGAQLKNAIGYWSRWLSDLVGIDTDDSREENGTDDETNSQHGHNADAKCFLLLNSLSDLLMLPKELLLEKSVREEVCPLIGLPLIVRILCNFTPDEFCPDPVPCDVLEDLNSESSLERRIPGNNSASSFPYAAAPLMYCPPSSANIAIEVGSASMKAEFGRKSSMVQCTGYMSDEDLDDLDSPLSSIIDRTLPISPANGNGSFKGGMPATMRFELLREVWSA